MNSTKLLILGALTAFSATFLPAQRADALFCCKKLKSFVNRATRAVSNTATNAARAAREAAERTARQAREAAERAARAAREAAAGARAAAEKAARAAKEAAEKAARAAKEAAEKAARLAKETAEKAAKATLKFANDVGDNIKTYANKGLATVQRAASAAWNAITSGMKWLADKVLELASNAVAGALKPLLGVFKAAIEAQSEVRLAVLKRRAPLLDWCGSFLGVNVGNLLQNAFKGALTAAILQGVKGTLTKAWMTLIASGEAARLAQNPGAAKALAKGGGTASLGEMIKANAKASVAGIAMVANMVLHAATFPIGYLTSWGACNSHAKRWERTKFKECYEREFVDTYSKNWLWDGIVSTALAPLDAIVIAPIALKIGAVVTAAVTAGIAAVTAGTGAIAAPAIGALTAFVVKVGINTALGMVAKKLFFGLYEKQTWTPSRSFFATMMGDAAKFFGPMCEGEPSVKNGARTCPNGETPWGKARRR